MNRKDVVETFVYNLERLRNELGYSQDKMASLLGLSSSTYRRIINLETTKIDLYTILKLYELSHKFAFQFCLKDYESDSLLKVVNTLTTCDKEELKDIENYIHIRKQISYDNDHKKSIILYKPVGDISDHLIFNTFSKNTLDISSCPLSIQTQVDCALEITNNHFHPTYHLHDVLLIANRAPKDGEIGLFIEKETMRIYIRVFKMESPRKLIPITDTGRIIEVDENNLDDMNKWIKFGVVISKMY